MANEHLKTSIESLSERKRKRKRITRIGWIAASACAVIVVACLMVPALTMEHNRYDCGLDEHTHTDQCFATQQVCEITSDKAHVHSPACYDKKGNLTCKEVSEGHLHVASCYDKNGKLTCDQVETVHIHTDACYDKNGKLTCDSKDKFHVHGDTCYTAVLGATKTSSAKASAEDSDDEDVDSKASDNDTDVTYKLTCTEESYGHVHCVACYDKDGKLNCVEDELIEVPHEHGDECFENVLACDIEEHDHDDNCLKEEDPAAIDQGVTAEGGDEDASEEASEEEVTDSVAEPDLTKEEIAEAEDQGLLYENKSMIIAFNVPDDIKDSIKLKVTEISDAEMEALTGENAASAAEAVENNDAPEQVDASAEEVASKAAEEEGAEMLSLGADGGEDTIDSNQIAAEQAAIPEHTSAASTTTATSEEPVYKANFKIDATLNGQTVDDIAELGITAKLQMKSNVIKPILKEIDYDDAAPEVKEDMGAIITLYQLPVYNASASISEIEDIKVQDVVATNTETSAMTFNVETQAISTTTASTANPTFSVQYYADLKTLDFTDNSEGNNKLSVIDTRGKKLPTNEQGQNVATTNLTVENGHIVKKSQLTEVYTSYNNVKYSKRPSMKYFDKLRIKKIQEEAENGDKVIVDKYTPLEIWITSDKSKADSINRNDWTIYDKNSKAYVSDENTWRFTNNPEEADNAIFINDGDTIRIVYKTTNGSVNSDSDFYDYDISDGFIYTSNGNAWNRTDARPTSNQKSRDDYPTAGIERISDANTYQQGINLNSNYNNSNSVKFAFGNANCGSGLSDLQIEDNYLNKYNGNVYEGCCFGLVTKLEKGASNPTYAEGVKAPNLFGSEIINGKTSVGSTSLSFSRDGDNHVLSNVYIGGNLATNDLTKFNNPKCGNKLYDHILTNNFWPMDHSVSTYGDDENYGANGHDLRFGGVKFLTSGANNITSKSYMDNYRRYGVSDNNNSYGAYKGKGFPLSDDGLDHNSFFGMHYKIPFELDSDYCGPLEYLFFGDDDLWIFLDGDLIVDIGGVHSSVGEYADLWDYLRDENGKVKSGEHTLEVFYTERGASGSTCYMDFTLPSVFLQPTEQNIGSLEIHKQVIAATDSSEEEFMFTVDLNDATNDMYALRIYDKSDKTLISSGYLSKDANTFDLRDNQYALISNLPEGLGFKVTEHLDEDEILAYVTTSTISTDPNTVQTDTITGTILKDQTVVVEYTNTKQYELPETGGSGAYWYWIFGGSLIVGAGLILFYRRRISSQV